MSRGAPTGVGPRRSLLRISGESEKRRRHIGFQRRLQKSQKKLSFATPNPWSALPREVYVGKGRGKKEGATTESPVDGQDQPKIYTIRDHTLEVLMHPDCATVACCESRPYTAW